MNAIFEPSGDHAGAVSSPAGPGTSFALGTPEAAFMIQISPEWL
jgi:hypothetical protein